MRFFSDTILLMKRSLREAIRQPANEIGNAFIPLFFYAVTVGAIGDVATQAFGVQDYKGFQLPVAILQGAAGVAREAADVILTRPHLGPGDVLVHHGRVQWRTMQRRMHKEIKRALMARKDRPGNQRGRRVIYIFPEQQIALICRFVRWIMERPIQTAGVHIRGGNLGLAAGHQ